MHRLAVARKKNEKKEVELDMFGQPLGKHGTEMQSYIGVLARINVKITYNEWKDVPAEVKDSIWESVNAVFTVNQAWKKACLISTNNKWRQFKTMLTNDYVFDREDSPDLYVPPKDYYFINSSDWSAFVKSRQSEKFRKLREKQKQIRAQSKYPHRLARKGYARYADENKDVLLKLTSGKTLALNDVLHVPSIRANLISVALLGKAGVKVTFESDKIVMTKNNILVGKGYCKNGLFVLNVSV